MRHGPARLAVDLGGTKIAAALIAGHRVLERRQIDTPRQDVASRLLPAIYELVRDLLPHSMGRIGVATTGFASAGKVSATNPATMPFPDGFDIGGALQALTGRELTVVNDAQAAAYGELVAGAGRGLDSFAFVTVSTGVGGGVVAGGRLLQGPSGFAGHLGHVVVEYDGPLCGCGRKGCVEAIASGTAIARRASEQLGFACDVPSAIQRADQGDPGMQRILEQAARAVSTLTANLKAVLDIEALIIGGGVGLNPSFLKRVKAAVAEEPALFRVSLLSAGGGPDAGLIGVAALSDADAMPMS